MGKRIQGNGFIGRMLTDLLGRPTTAKDVKADRAPASGTIGVYRFVDRRIAGLVVSDLPCSARTSAAMCLIPPGAAEDAEAAGALTKSLAENLVEVYNVCSRFFSSLEAPRVVLDTTHTLPGPLPPDVSAALEGPVEQVHLVVDIEGYGGGRMSLLAG